MFEERLKYLRTSLHYSQVELASALSVTKQSVSNWENGNILPSVDILIKLSDFFHVSTDYLLGRNDERTLYIDGLTDTQITHLQNLIDDLVEARQA